MNENKQGNSQNKASLKSEKVFDFSLKSNLPFDFRYSYSETNPSVEPIGYREPPRFSPFGPGQLDRKWTGTYALAEEAVVGGPLSEEEVAALVEWFRHNNGSQQINLAGYEIIDVLPWDEWWNFELTKDESNPHISLLPLHPDVRAKFNETVAWEYALSMVGKPYGYHNLIFSWIDTIDGNYPPPLDAHVVASVMTVWNNVQPDYAANMWNEALNKRLGTKKLKGVGSSFDELLTIPKQDNWIYSDGSLHHVSFSFLICTRKQGCLIQLQTPFKLQSLRLKDAYTLKLFENNSSRLPKWCKDADTVKLPFCQIRGKYRMELPGYNTMDPYPDMNERCPSLPPKYSRPKGC
ncbi:unnamed protein product [Camellia sinensis]